MKRFAAMLLCAALGAMTPAIAAAQDEPAADLEFKDLTSEAAQAYEAGEYDRAVSLFKQAYALRNVSNILYNIGRIYEDAGDIDGAIEYYDQFVVAPNVEQASRKDALERLTTLREVQKLQNGEPEPTEVVVQPPPPAPVEPKPRPARTAGWIFLGVGGASLITSGVFALLTQSQFDKFENAGSLQDRRAAANSGRTNAAVADVMLITGVVTGIVGGVLVIASSDPESPSTAVRVSPVVGNAWGVGFDVNF